MEEKFKRSERRHRTRTILKRRIKNWLFFDIHVSENFRLTGVVLHSNAEKERYVLEGKGFQFLRTTSNPCNCWMCSGEYKYRTHRAEEKRKVRKEIENHTVTTLWSKC